MLASLGVGTADEGMKRQHCRFVPSFARYIGTTISGVKASKTCSNVTAEMHAHLHGNLKLQPSQSCKRHRMAKGEEVAALLILLFLLYTGVFDSIVWCRIPPPLYDVDVRRI